MIGVTGAVARRWPTVLGVVLAADVFLDEVTAAATHGYARLLMLLPLIYVVVAVLRRPGASWPVLAVLGVLFVLLRILDVVEPAVVILAAALGATVWGAAHGRHRDPDFRLQLAGMVGFAAVAVVALLIHPDLGRYLVAAGMLAHGIWDVVHLVEGRTVARSYAEWCAALDVTPAAGLVVVPLL